MLRIRTAVTLIGTFLFVICASGCKQNDDPKEFVARVDNEVLTQDDLSAALRLLPISSDSSEAREQIIEQWVTNELLYREAVKAGLRKKPQVQRLLDDNERSVLISELLSGLYTEERSQPNEDEIRNYYERHREQLTLREPYVRLRYFIATSLDSARFAEHLLRQSKDEANRDSVWSAVEKRFATETSHSSLFSRAYYPESRLLEEAPAFNDVVPTLAPGDVSPVVQSNGQYMVLYLEDRLPTGNLPDLDIIRDQILDQVRIEKRKQLYARHVQRLRNEALAGEDLVIH